MDMKFVDTNIINKEEQAGAEQCQAQEQPV